MLFSPDRFQLTVNSKKETNSRVKMGKESKWGKGQDGLLLLPPERVKMGCCCLPPDRVKLTVNSKKETNSWVKMGQESRSAYVIYPLKKSKWDKGHYELWLFTPHDRVKLIVNSRVKMGCCCLPLSESN